MATNRKSGPPEKWWGNDPFGTSVEVQTSSEYRAFLKERRNVIESHKSKALALRAKRRVKRLNRYEANGYKPHNGCMVKLIKDK